ncbi:hypothetical protein JANAI62_10910 [Jannaschia pagri]|uniref:DUF302 domain-containing protein n=1 Tax=Jannaschia pagri TaxID=2829797 RepID=A0ABQ4NJ83_9RHOB|nr:MULTISPECIES: DUF302 domain-containing protein [unclassified Jannaschia]GIT90636.1 hypothetical protein JANAI61_10940 [Jannaschia sp. AI_61]GIT94468.1 hypothetical protein JANAI62_10910 [Jannaschia sp. AI_62]
MIRSILVTCFVGLTAMPAAAFEAVTSPHSVTETMDRLVAAVEGAGATVFARVDHGVGAASVEMDLPDAQLLVFGNPRIGSPIMQDDLRAGLVLPLRVLVHEGEAGTVVTWQSPDEMFAGMDVDLDAKAVQMMQGALGKLTGAATSE